jgi:hypothetical protein
LHVLEPFLIGLLVVDELDPRTATGQGLDPAREISNRDLLVAADVEDLADRIGMLGETDQRARDVPDPAEAARLLAVTEDRDGRVTVRSLISSAWVIAALVQAGPPSASSALRRMRAWVSVRAAAVPQAISCWSWLRCSGVSVT